ncbi:MAG TPA: DUF5624 domain-containing protein [Galbitalea sp.]|jgi:hypothetical protein|nr:DUF5624 domain-containing protein [Galbitalea sp.]
MSEHESPELIDLFNAYTASPQSIGRRFTAATARASKDDPLLVATGADIALFPGGGAEPEVLGFRLSTRGFKELAAVSHLGPALATLIALRRLEPDGTWRQDAEGFLAECRRSRAANSEQLWRETIAVEAFRGREQSIARMVDYSCAITIRYLEDALAHPERLTFETLRDEYLEGTGQPELPVPFNRIMIATFFLVGLETANRFLAWFDSHELDWSKAMVIIAGKQGRPSAGVTWRTNSIANILLVAARGALPLDRLLIAPHAPVFDTPQDGDLSGVVALEPALRGLWAGTHAVMDIGAQMFEGYPAFSPDEGGAVELDDQTITVGDMPAIRSPEDWFSMVTRLRLVMEDPRQLLSGAVSDFAAAQLVAGDNDPRSVIVPGLDGEPYPEVPDPTAGNAAK